MLKSMAYLFAYKWLDMSSHLCYTGGTLRKQKRPADGEPPPPSGLTPDAEQGGARAGGMVHLQPPFRKSGGG